MAETKTKDRPANQSEGEFFSLVGTGRKGVEDALAKTLPEIMSVAAASIREAPEPLEVPRVPLRRE